MPGNKCTCKAEPSGRGPVRFILGQGWRADGNCGHGSGGGRVFRYLKEKHKTQHEEVTSPKPPSPESSPSQPLSGPGLLEGFALQCLTHLEGDPHSSSANQQVDISIPHGELHLVFHRAKKGNPLCLLGPATHRKAQRLPTAPCPGCDLQAEGPTPGLPHSPHSPEFCLWPAAVPGHLSSPL